jgi:glycine cleavage system H protein
VNQEPYGGGWMFDLRPADGEKLDELLDAAAYDRLTDED